MSQGVGGKTRGTAFPIRDHHDLVPLSTHHDLPTRQNFAFSSNIPTGTCVYCNMEVELKLLGEGMWSVWASFVSEHSSVH
jgi:hypothetical protein